MRSRWLQPVDNASLAFFRIFFGLMMIWELVRQYADGEIHHYYAAPLMHFTYYGFGWIKPWPGEGVYLHFIGLGVLALLMTIGLWYRVATFLFFLGFTYVFLLEQTAYQNHLYLICLLSLLMSFLPAQRAWSMDVRLGRVLSASTAPAWTLWLLRFQIGVVYFYGGLAKLNHDWLHGEPMRTWLSAKSDYPIVGTWVTREWLIGLFSYGGLALDLLVVPFLLWKKSRPYAFAVAILFHLTNALMWEIGIFPWMMIGATALFLAPDLPRRLLAKRPTVAPEAPRPLKPIAACLLGLYVTFQLLFPFRHFLYPGDPNWGEEGHFFAWHMMLRNKRTDSQTFVMRHDGGRTRVIRLRDHLERWHASRMLHNPDMILQFVHEVAELKRREGFGDVEIYASVKVSLNGRNPQLLIDPSVDLAAQPRTWRPYRWIEPLTEPLPAR